MDAQIEKTNVRELLGEKQAAKMLGVSRPTLLRIRKKGEIRFYEYGGRIRYKTEFLDEYLKRTERAPAGVEGAKN